MLTAQHLRYRAYERYQPGWLDPRPAQLPYPSWEPCICCERDTPHLNGCCVYDGEPTPLIKQRLLREFRTR